MKPLRIAEDILPIAKFKARASEVVRGLRGRDRPVIITHNGEAAAVLLSPQEFDRLSRQARFITAVHEGLMDSDAGRVVADDHVDRILDERLGKRPR